MADLITPAELAALSPGLASLSPPALATLASAASRAVERHCRRPFGREEGIVQALDGRGRPFLFLPRPPIVAIASVAIDGGDPLAEGEDYAIADPDWGVLRRGTGRGEARSGPRWPSGVGRVVVTYDGGFDPIPDDVKLAAAQQALYLRDAARASGRYQSERLGDYSYALAPESAVGGSPAAGMSAAAAALLAPYVLHGFG